MQPSPSVLVTGSAGRIGQAVVSELTSRGLNLRAFDQVPTPGLPQSMVGTISDQRAVQSAMDGVEVLVHLAATPDDDDDFFHTLLPNNIVGLYNIMEAARRARVRRIILASTGQVNWWQRMKGPVPVRPEDAPTPRYWYAATKVFSESIGRGFAETHGISVIAVRLGWCPRSRAHIDEIASTEWARDVYLSPGDAGRFFARAVLAPADIRFAIVYATSKPLVKTYFDLEPSRKLIGFEPEDQWPDGIESLIPCEQTARATA